MIIGLFVDAQLRLMLTMIRGILLGFYLIDMECILK